ncbi:MAG: ABC transporter ATP-binding protein [Anaerolineaceae bacterium]|nr:ABC transporter ATP-binding protein [Anaerolineaceae bacterium]
MQKVIEINNVSKHYKDVKAVDGISLQVNQGEIYGFLGLNGAGKTTTIRTLLGMIQATHGSVSVFGQMIAPGQGPWKQVGYMVESPSAYPSLTVRENLEIARRLHELDDRHIVDKTIEKLGISHYAQRKAGTLSTGNLQRLGLARAMLHNPGLLILDEPANGLDPAGVIEIRNLLADLAQQGVTIFMSSHILSEVDRLATNIGIIHHGKLLENLGMHELEKFRLQRLEIEVRSPELALSTLKNAGFHVEVNGSQNHLVLTEIRAVEQPEKIASLLVKANIPLKRLAVEQQNLEEHFMQLTGAS